MPKKVDHDQRRREIAAAVARIAADRGLNAASFREVAAEAGVSVSLVQHYFGTKENLLIGTLDIYSLGMGNRILERLDDLGPDAAPLDRIRTVAIAFLPTDEQSRTAMLLYHAFAAAALTDETLRSTEAFRNGTGLRAFFAAQLTLAHEQGAVAGDIAADDDAQAIMSLILGLSLTMLLEPTSARHAEDVLDAHLARLGS